MSRPVTMQSQLMAFVHETMTCRTLTAPQRTTAFCWNHIPDGTDAGGTLTKIAAPPPRTGNASANW
jgi:hypothetical protein